VKILQIHNYYQRPGGEDAVFDHDRSILLNSGHQVITYCRSNAELSELSLAERVLMLKAFISSERAKQDVWDLLRRERPTIVHVYNTFAMITPSIFDACRSENIPVVQAVQNYRLVCPTATLFRSGKTCTDCDEKGLWSSVRHGCYRQSRLTTAVMAVSLGVHRKRGIWNTHVDAYIAPSEFVRRKLTKAAIPEEKIFLRPNFLSADPGARFSPGRHALFVGRLSDEKGIFTLLRAWNRIQIDIPLRIVGDGPLRSQIESEISSNQLTNVELTGWLERKDVHEAMKSAKFLIFPSEWYEPFGLTIVEGFACGAPVIGSRLGAVEELIKDGRTGLLFTAGNPEDLAHKIKWAVRHPEKLRDMGKAARREYEEKYNANVNYAKLMNIYSRVLEKRNPTGSSAVLTPDANVA